MQAIILSGGLGTRLRPLTDTTPKPMLPIDGIPHLEYQIDLLKSHGITDIIFSTGYLHEQIVNYFGDGSRFGCQMQYVHDGEIARGTAGAVKNCENLIDKNQSSFLVLNGDILTDMDLGSLIKFHYQKFSVITLALTPVVDPSSFGVAVLNEKGQVEKFVEKPKTMEYGNLINAGVYVMKSGILYSMEADKPYMFESDIFPSFAKAGMVYGQPMSSHWIDIGTLERYDQANQMVAEGKINFHV